jgi:GxxExxY protein
MNADRIDWMDAEEINDITRRIIGCAFEVGTQLGIGYLEKIYENALVHEMRKRGLHVQQQVPLQVIYDGVVVGEYVADMIVEETVLVELKSVPAIIDAHMAQCLSYLKTTGLSVGLILNFGTPRVQTKRLVRNF